MPPRGQPKMVQTLDGRRFPVHTVHYPYSKDTWRVSWTDGDRTKGGICRLEGDAYIEVERTEART